MEGLVSVIMPVYNGEKTIIESVYSVCNQNYCKIEIILIDDCSSDSSYEKISKLAQEDGRIKVYQNEENIGVAKSRNIGLKAASGEFVAFLDSDDLWRADKLQMQIEMLKQAQAEMCYTAYSVIDGNGNLIIDYCTIPKNVTYTSLLKNNVLVCSSVLLKKDVLPVKGFSDSFFHEDLVLWLWLLKNEVKAIGLNEVLVLYRKGGRSSNKWNAMRHRWKIYRDSEQLGLFRSGYYFICYGVSGVWKHIIKK